MFAQVLTTIIVAALIGLALTYGPKLLAKRTPAPSSLPSRQDDFQRGYDAVMSSHAFDNGSRAARAELESAKAQAAMCAQFKPAKDGK